MIIIFDGFNEKTSEFFFLLSLSNSKAYLLDNTSTYNNYVKTPLKELHKEMSPVLLEIDNELCNIPSRCISGIYNDVRFGNKDTPLRNYMWVRFKCMCNRDTDIPGFFFDASYDNYRYGLRIYNMTTGGMQKIRDTILNDSKGFSKLANQLDTNITLELCGHEYVKDHYPEHDLLLKTWLNKKDFYIHCTRAPSETYYSHALVNELSSAYQSLADIYIFLKKALQHP